MTLLLTFDNKTVDYDTLNWDEIIDTLKFYRHYSKVPLHVYVFGDNVEVSTRIKSAVHFNTFIMMVEEIYRKECERK